jgi:hypothetical protein
VLLAKLVWLGGTGGEQDKAARPKKTKLSRLGIRYEDATDGESDTRAGEEGNLTGGRSHDLSEAVTGAPKDATQAQDRQVIMAGERIP